MVYRSVADQLDNIYHNGIDAWKATIKVYKNVKISKIIMTRVFKSSGSIT